MRGRNDRQQAMLTIFDTDQRVPEATRSASRPWLTRHWRNFRRASIKGPALRDGLRFTRALLGGVLVDKAAHSAQRAYVVRATRLQPLLFRCFLDELMSEPWFDQSTFSRNRAWLLKHVIANEFFRVVVARAPNTHTAI